MLKQCVDATPNDRVARISLERCQGQIDSPADILRPWLDEYSVGIASIDADHTRLLASTNALIGDILAGRSENLAAAIAALGKSLDAHFDAEERLMEDAAFPFMVEHAREHRRLRQSFHQFAAAVAAGKEDFRYLAFNCQCVIADWLIDHAQKADRALGSYLARSAQEAA
jgi:hemerythrin